MGIRSQGGASNAENYVPAIFRDIFGRTGVDAVAPHAPSQGINASGGVISDYAPPTAPTTYYRAHVFTNPGTFVVSDLGTTMPNTVEYLVVGGGGGGGHGQDSNEGSGGGGASGDDSGGTGGDGSDGVIILRLSSDYEATFTSGVTYTSATSGSEKIYTITATSNSSQTVTFD